MKQFALATVLGLVAAQSDKCNGLVLSGGANNGAWEAGLMWGLMHYGNPDDFGWNTFSGVSAGSINTMYMATGAPEDLHETLEQLSTLWQTTTTSDIWVPWDGGLTQGLLQEAGLVDNSPMVPYFESILGGLNISDYGSPWTIAAVNVGTGEYTQFNQTNTPFPEIMDASISSSSIPGAFPPHQYKGNYYMDGGTVLNTNIVSAIDQCKALGFDENNIVLDVMICGAESQIDTIAAPGNTLGNWNRARSFKNHDNGVNSLSQTQQAYPDVWFRYTEYQPDGTSTSGLNELSFNNATTYPLQMVGRQQASDLIACGASCQGPNPQAMLSLENL